MSTSSATDHEPADAGVRDAHEPHDDDEALGPIDWPAWRAAIVGVAVAALMVFLLAMAAWG